MKGLCFVLLLLVSTISVSHVGTVFASPTLTIVIVANNGARTVTLKIMTLVPHPWGAGDSDDLYGWSIIEEKPGVSVSARSQKTLLYDLSPGVYVINVCWVADLGGMFTSVGKIRMVVLRSDATVTLVVN